MPPAAYWRWEHKKSHTALQHECRLSSIAVKGIRVHIGLMSNKYEVGLL